MVWFVVAAASLVAGIIQSVTGFGSVVFLMMVLPFYFDMIDAPALAIVINQLFCMALCWKYRRHIQWRMALPPTIAFGLANLLTMPFVSGLGLSVLVLVFAVFLMALSVFFLAFARRIKVTPRPASGVVCGALCGISAGLFAIGGPPMAVYFVAAAEDHLSYLACMQFLFTVTGVTGIVGRLCSGLLHAAILPYAAAGAVCILLGAVIGGRIASCLNAEIMRNVVYVFVGVSGLILLLQQIL